MAVSIDTVYQKVLAILNKEQRGYITPQEFNLFANQAQLDLFEQYFYDINQFSRIPGNDTEYSDMLNLLNEKINIFEANTSLVYSNNHFALPDDLYRIGTIIYSRTTTDGFNVTTTEQIEAEKINKNEFLYINSSPLTKPTDTRPIFTSDSSGIKVYGGAELITDISCNYIKKPATPEWAYQMVYGEALYDSTNSVDFELHASEETELVIKILGMAGLLIKDLQMYQLAEAEDARAVQQEKQ